MAKAGKPEQEVKREVDQRLREIELLKRQAQDQGLAFSALGEAEITRKVRGEASGTPYIYSLSWTSGASPGNPAYFAVYISNPDPNGYYPVFASIFFGVANFLNNAGFGEAASDGNFNMDRRWPYMSTRPFSLAAGATANETFNYTTPAGVPLTTYIGNVVVWRGEHHDQGVYFDRGLFYVTLS
jgi:hypothetical protein